jgi:hypothetical protein
MKRCQSLRELPMRADAYVPAAPAGKIRLMHPAWLMRLAALVARAVITSIEHHHRAVSE